MSPINIISGNGGDDSIWAIVAIGVSLVTGAFSIWWSFHSEKRSNLDNFWFREVTAPACIEPALDMRKEWTQKIEGLGNTQLTKVEYQKLIGELEAAINIAISKAWVSKVFKGDLYKSIITNYEEVADTFALSLQRHVDSPNVVPIGTAFQLSADVSELLMDVLATAAKANLSKLELA